MENANLIAIEVAYASPTQQQIIPVKVEPTCTIENAIHRSGILIQFPEIDLAIQKVGVFSKVKKLHDKVKAGDRIEIYRALTMDPKEMRRKRAKSKKI